MFLFTRMLTTRIPKLTGNQFKIKKNKRSKEQIRSTNHSWHCTNTYTHDHAITAGPELLSNRWLLKDISFSFLLLPPPPNKIKIPCKITISFSTSTHSITVGSFYYYFFFCFVSVSSRIESPAESQKMIKYQT